MYSLVLVEDDYQIRNGLSRFFPWGEASFELVNSFENGKKALDYLAINDVDVVLTDIRMPVMDGITLADELKKIKPDICVIFLTAYRDFEYAQKAVSLGVKNYIVKSTKYDELIRIFDDIRLSLDEKKNQPDPQRFQEEDIMVDNQIIGRVIQSINADIANATLQQQASLAKISPVYLSRFFKEKTGMNFADYVMKRKMEKSRELLSSTDYTIAKISEIVGYSNEKNFSRAFKKYHGVTPFDYRHLL